jgi:hypothetical protein
MNGIVACTMSIAATDISCIIRIFINKPKKSTPYRCWEIIGGSLFDIFPYGKMGEWKLFEGNLKIIGMFPGFAIPYVPVGPVIDFDSPEPFTVAELKGVPENFLDAVTPQNTVRGEGKLGVTNEKLNWSMWYRTL